MSCWTCGELPVNGGMQRENDHVSDMSERGLNIRCGRLRKRYKSNG